jgi:hypothetical protein
LELEDTSKWEGGGQRTHPIEATRRRVKVAREGCCEERVTKDANSVKRGGVVAESVGMEGRGVVVELDDLDTKNEKRGTTHHTTGAHTLKLHSVKTVASARHYPSHANAQAHSIRLQALAEHNTGSRQVNGGADVKRARVEYYSKAIMIRGRCECITVTSTCNSYSACGRRRQEKAYCTVLYCTVTVLYCMLFGHPTPVQTVMFVTKSRKREIWPSSS